MEYIALCDSYGFGGRYLKEGDTVIITDEEKAKIDADYFNKLFKPVGALTEESVENTEESVDKTEESVEKPKRTRKKKTEEE